MSIIKYQKQCVTWVLDTKFTVPSHFTLNLTRQLAEGGSRRFELNAATRLNFLVPIPLNFLKETDAWQAFKKIISFFVTKKLHHTYN